MSARPRTVLIVDQDDAWREAAAAALRADYRVLRASSGESALAMLMREDVDAMLLDVEQPGVSGFELRLFDGKDWLPDWNSLDSRNFAPAPYAVEITLTVVNDRGESETFQTAVDVPMARGLRAPRAVAGPTPRG